MVRLCGDINIKHFTSVTKMLKIPYCKSSKNVTFYFETVVMSLETFNTCICGKWTPLMLDNEKLGS